MTAHIRGFAPGLLLEKRWNDGVDGNTSKASKYEFYFLDQEESILHIITFIYFQSAQKGIIYETITSPANNAYLDRKYTSLDRPYIIDKFVGCSQYSIELKTILLKPDSTISKSQNILNLLNKDTLFYKNLEKFIIDSI